MARDAFATFIPISVESEARTKIIFDFFDLMAAIAAHGKSNGMGGRNLSRLAGWWAFEQFDNGNGFEGGYKSWARSVNHTISRPRVSLLHSAADATCHLFFAYLRSLSPESVRGVSGISALPITLQTLAEATEYPPEQTSLLTISKVVMIVNRVSPTPFSLLRRAKHFEYRADDLTLQQFSDFDDPVQALTEECRRVLKCISSTNQSAAATSKASTSLRNPDAEWSRFEDLGFGSFANESEDDLKTSAFGRSWRAQHDLASAPRSQNNDMGRPTTPSWADFLNSGFVDDSLGNGPAPLLLPPDKILPPIDAKRTMSSDSYKPNGEAEGDLEPGELASINNVLFDDVFWWVWISSLAGEEPPDRKAVFGRCALLETDIRGGKWLVLEEMVQGAAPEPEMGYIAEKKSRNPFSKRSRLGRTKTSKKILPAPKPESYPRSAQQSPLSKNSISNDQHARIQAAAAALQRKQKDTTISPRRGRADDARSKTNSVFTLQPVIMSEAGPAMKWANAYDKNAIRAKYLGDKFAGKGSATNLESAMDGTNGSVTPAGKAEQIPSSNSYGSTSQAKDDKDRSLPALPPQSPVPASTQPLPPPPPPPETPAKDPSSQATIEAAEVSLPATTPNERSLVERKPLPAADEAAQVPLPATTPLESEKPLFSTVAPAQHTPVAAEMQSSPESQKGRKRLKRKETGGLRGFFARKKSEHLPSNAPPQPADTAAVAAARAALSTGPPPAINYVAPGGAPSSLSRRFSGIGRKKSPAVQPKSSPSVPNIPDEERPASPPMYDPQPRMADRYDPKSRVVNNYHPSNRYDTQASISRASSEAQQEADHAFDRFDQGPVDQPAFVPEDSPQHSPQPASTPASTRTATPTEQRALSSRVSSESEAERPPSPGHDRWAQIRKNAAQRAAARQHEDPSGISAATRTDEGDGETSGEETIESRVARIKARVAELTGNMQQAGGRP
ncbi:MAG: hypothetical protein LQ350_007269 [Teloschistes chrysophthalmus]|nr:MAG: hypothetical protein LQ350_007269 [Niorma chrysophthalma]